MTRVRSKLYTYPLVLWLREREDRGEELIRSLCPMNSNFGNDSNC